MDSSDALIQEGDIIFLSIPNALYRKVASATGSPTSHVGIVFKDTSSQWVVAESTIPLATYTPLPRFLKRSDDGWHCIRRMKGGLSSKNVAALRSACDERMGALYHLGFRYESRRQFCSKLVYDVYRSALGIEVGQLESFHDLLSRNPRESLAFWRLWFFGIIPWSRLTVTPASQMESPALETVFLSRYLSRN